jgi:hypothetical protein
MVYRLAGFDLISIDPGATGGAKFRSDSIRPSAEHDGFELNRRRRFVHLSPHAAVIFTHLADRLWS